MESGSQRRSFDTCKPDEPPGQDPAHLGKPHVPIQFTEMEAVLRLSVVAMLSFGLAGGALAGPLPRHPDPVDGHAARSLQSALSSAARHATVTAENQVLQEADDPEPYLPTGYPTDRAALRARASVSSVGLCGQRMVLDHRHAIRLIYRGAQALHSSEEPPEQSRSQS